MAFVLGATTAAAHFQPGGHRLDAPGYAWLAAAALPLLFVRRFPLPVFLVCYGAVLAYYWSDYPSGPALLLPTIALFTLTHRRGPLFAGVAGVVALAVAAVVSLATGGTVVADARAALLVVWLAAVLGIGTAARNRAAAIRAARERAAEHQYRMTEQERLRIAREVHDVVAHSLAMINVQAGVAAHVADRRPEQAVEALLAIKEASASALADLRATVAVLRSGQGLGPAPSLRQLGELVEHARATGLTVRVHGSPGELPAPLDGAAYRILQESLTNVVRHAREASEVDVSFGRSNGSFSMRVKDNGRDTGPPTAGNGLRGMSERAAALGGTVRAQRADDGFEVRAELPVEEDR
ncbi:sensor histidine kinase [Amycolatopsis acidiphila]|uniref:histidine kinase n=1 Tax=Amycolatopsis acidiphila TaxID=715473 RepID=A0A558AFY7_9PSEU|nr:sensor histidine kinase [Amycolatopsis acidiphila]TVT23179.1 sensor histidine kinase [Amycolatopsis acidiphila]UIJ64158.1 sensor histidine kinase [Amycolatopsis acidiphila]